MINRKIRFGPASLGFITIMLLSLLSLFYLAQSNEVATKGYLIRSLEQKKQEAVAENKRLQVEAARLRSISEIKNKAEELGVVPVKKLEYLGKKAVAAK